MRGSKAGPVRRRSGTANTLCRVIGGYGQMPPQYPPPVRVFVVGAYAGWGFRGRRWPFARFYVSPAYLQVRIVLPLSAPALATLAALTFLDSWNSFLWPLIAINSTSEMTLPLGLATFQGAHSTEWTLLMAGNVMSLAPDAAGLLASTALLRPVGRGDRPVRDMRKVP